ncbi:hypothetical protein DFH06DRAFT_471413 [Mycena polygramma]|nr:hypothetical protein DFH06DRAFT_471413 [Mycena polygramma]
MLFPFTSRSSKGSQKFSVLKRTTSKWNLLRSSAGRSDSPASALSPFPKTLTDQASMELYEFIIDCLGPDKSSLVACNLVCRSWAARSRFVLRQLMVCHPVPLINRGGFERIRCAVPTQGSKAGIIYGNADGVYSESTEGSRRQLLSIRGVMQIGILPDSNLFLCLAGSHLVTLPLSTFHAGTARENDITRVSKRVRCFSVYRSMAQGGSYRVCVLKNPTLDGSAIKVFDTCPTGLPNWLAPLSGV